MSTYCDIFYRIKPPSKSASMRTRGRKDPTRRQGQQNSHRSPYWTRVTTFFTREVAVTELPADIFLSFFRPRFTIHRDLSIGSTSKSIEGVVYRKCQSRVSPYFPMEKNNSLWICNVRLNRNRRDILKNRYNGKQQAVTSKLHRLFSHTSNSLNLSLKHVL